MRRQWRDSEGHFAARLAGLTHAALLEALATYDAECVRAAPGIPEEPADVADFFKTLLGTAEGRAVCGLATFAIPLAREGDGEADARLQAARARQHGMGICHLGCVECAVVCRAGECCSPLHWRPQAIGACQHRLGICNGASLASLT